MDFSLQSISKGVWYIIHNWAINSTSIEERKAYCLFIRSLTINFVCDTCRLHLIENIKNDPPEKYINSAENLFMWSWKLHNKATADYNTKNQIQKPLLDYEYAKSLYVSTTCNNCTVSEKQEDEPIEIKPVRLSKKNGTIIQEDIVNVVSRRNQGRRYVPHF